MDSLPDLLPARMLNEYVYCPRLFYLEWVDDRWADSGDTEEGRFAHRAADRAGGRLPAPELVELLKEVRSLRVESPRLGLVAVVDRVVGEDGTAVPIDVKKGRPGPDGEPWPADRVQVLAQAAVLRDSGYPVDHAVIYYVETNQRVEVAIDDAAIDEVVALVAEARQVAERVLPPLPLIDSPKCPRCSLVGICLPDETNLLRERSTKPPRRIVPRAPDSRPVYVTEPGAYVGVKGGRLVVRKESTTIADVRLIDVSQLCVYGRVQVSTEALNRLWAHDAVVLWFSYNGWLNGWSQGQLSRYVELRRRQVAVHGQGGLGIARAMIAGKIRNSRTLLMRNSRVPQKAAIDSLARLRQSAESAVDVGVLLGLEGTAARLYFGSFTSMIAGARAYLADGFDLNGRSRRPAPDPLNCLLSYVYGLLVKDLVAVCIGVGLDPYIGVLHRPRFGRPSLALDLAEEFRPLIADSVVVGLLNNGEVDETQFVIRGAGVALTQEGRRAVIRAYERRLDTTVTHPVFGYKITYRRVLDVQARILAGVMLGELDAYLPMATR